MALGNKMAGGNPEIDMTPMIDCIFQLLIFFMLITEITQADLAQLELPKASMAKPDDKPPKDRLVLNICKATDEASRVGVIQIKGRQYSTESPVLIKMLLHEADPGGTGRFREKDKNGASSRPLLIRCDRRVEYDYFQRVLTLCANPNLGIKIYMIQIGIAKEQKRGED